MPASHKPQPTAMNQERVNRIIEKGTRIRCRTYMNRAGCTRTNGLNERVQYFKPTIPDSHEATAPIQSPKAQHWNQPLPSQRPPLSPPPTPPENQNSIQPLLSAPLQPKQRLAQFYNESASRSPYPPFKGYQYVYPFPPRCQTQVTYLPFWFTTNPAQPQPQQPTVPINCNRDLVQPVSSYIVSGKTSNDKDPRTQPKTQSTKWKIPKRVTGLSKPDYKKVKRYSQTVSDPRLHSDAEDCDYSNVPMELCEPEQPSKVYNTICSTDESSPDRPVDTSAMSEYPLQTILTSFQEVMTNITEAGQVKENESLVGQKSTRVGENATSEDTRRVGGDVNQGVYKLANVENKCHLNLGVSKNLFLDKIEFVKKIRTLLTMGLESLQRAMEKKINKKTALTFKMEDLKFQELEEEAQRFLNKEEKEYKNMDTAQLLKYRDGVFDSKKLITRERSEMAAKLGRSCGQDVVDRMFHIIFQFQKDYFNELTVAICNRCEKRKGSISSSKATTNKSPELVDLTLSDNETSYKMETWSTLETGEPVPNHSQLPPTNDFNAESQSKRSTIVSTESPGSSINIDTIAIQKQQVDNSHNTFFDSSKDVTEREEFKRPFRPWKIPIPSSTRTNTSLNAIKVSQVPPRSTTPPFKHEMATNQYPIPSVNTSTRASTHKLPIIPKPFLYGIAQPFEFSLAPYLESPKIAGVKTLQMPTDLSKIPAKKAKHRSSENSPN